MTPQEQRPSREEMIEVFRSMQRRMRNYAFHHLGGIGPRTLAGLQNLDLVDAPSEELPQSMMDVDVLNNPDDSRRVPLLSGPFLLYAAAEDSGKRRIAEISVLLLSESLELRRGAVAEFDRMIAAGSLAITPKTHDRLEALRASVCSDVSTEWRPAAIALFDALNDDILVALQGIRQCLACEPAFSEGLQLFVPQLIYPRISSLDSIQLDVSNLETDHTHLLEVIDEIVSGAADLGEACAGYMTRLGYLTLASPYSMAAVANRWRASHPDCDVWNVVWDWVRKSGTPLARYHASSVFVQHSDWVPDGKCPELWSAILSVISGAGARPEEISSEQEPWALRRDLARHFLFYLEAHLPDNDGASIACFAWWLAERVAAIFPDDPKSAKYYRENWVKPSLDKSVYLWTTAMSRIRNSTLRSITVHDSSPWATASMALMVGKFEQLIPKDAKPEELALLNDALIYSQIGALPLSESAAESPTYAQEIAQWHIVQDWAQHLAGEQRQVAEQLAEANRRLCTTDGLLESLKGVAGKTLPDQFAVGMVFKSKAYIDPSIAEAVWEILKDAEWRRRSLDNADERVLALLLEGFGLLGIQDRDKWLLPVPHYFAEMCERTEDDTRRRILFLLVIQASLAADTVSAIQRLLHGEKKALFAPFATEYHEQIQSAWAMFPAWVQGRLRGILASLHVM